jgi:hypothetical protein
MYAFLDRVGENDLRTFLQRICSPEHYERIKSLGRSEIYSALFSLYGFDILYEKRIRRLLFLGYAITTNKPKICEAFWETDQATVIGKELKCQ